MINNTEHFHEKKFKKSSLGELSVTSVVLIVILFTICGSLLYGLDFSISV